MVAVYGKQPLQTRRKSMRENELLNCGMTEQTEDKKYVSLTFINCSEHILWDLKGKLAKKGIRVRWKEGHIAEVLEEEASQAIEIISRFNNEWRVA